MGTTEVSLLVEALEASQVMVLATQASGAAPYPTPLFYCTVPELAAPCLVFASRPSSTHGEHLGDGPTAVAAGTYVPVEGVGNIRGTQLRGEAIPIARCDDGPRRRLRNRYLTRFPMAAAVLAKAALASPERREQLYVLAVTWAKLTDNARLGLGKHAQWTFDPPWTALGVRP